MEQVWKNLTIMEKKSGLDERLNNEEGELLKEHEWRLDHEKEEQLKEHE